MLFDGKNAIYQGLHEQIIGYLKFRRDVSATGALTQVHIDQWFRFELLRTVAVNRVAFNQGRKRWVPGAMGCHSSTAIT